MVRRFKVFGIGLLLGVVFALWTAGPMMPSGWGFRDRLLAWSLVMGGPIAGTLYGFGFASFYPAIGLGWLGALLIPAHPLRPCQLTGCLTLLGFSLWFFTGFLDIMELMWGG